MSEPFLAEVRIFAFDFPPVHWALCNGALLPIQQATALFSLLGTNYGGDGKTTFALPNLQGVFPLGQSRFNPAPGLSERNVGEFGGARTVNLTLNEIPGHTHGLRGDTTSPAVQSPTNAALGLSTAVKPYHPGPGDTQLAPMQIAGSSFSHNNMPPYLVLNFCIAMTGIFPARP
jgi:microcystin-dependent protein